MQAIEDQLLDETLDHHPNATAALDTALDDMAALSLELQHSRRRPLLLRSTANLNRIEDLLLEAIVRTHPHRERALDRLLADVAGADEDRERPVELIHHEQVAFDGFVDNDFDGCA
jgi:hypothetical protein